MANRLYRSSDKSIVGGVCGGLGEYFDIDPVIIRVIAVLLFFASQGAAVVAYIVAWIIVPLRPLEETATPTEPIVVGKSKPGWYRFIPGLLLVLIGSIMLARQFWWWLDWEDFLPTLLILAGLAVIGYSFINRSRKSNSNLVDGYPAQQTNGHNGGTSQ